MGQTKKVYLGYRNVHFDERVKNSALIIIKNIPIVPGFQRTDGPALDSGVDPDARDMDAEGNPRRETITL